MNRKSLPTLTLAFISLTTTGCGAIFDVAYLAGSKRYEEVVSERKPTGQMNSTIEYESSMAPDGKIQLTCEKRDRRIERTFSVTKTYQYRGGYGRSAYIASAVLSGVVAGAIGGIVALACTLPPQPGEVNPKRWSCYNALIATPFAVDLGYSLIRVATAKKPKLVDKQKTEGQLAMAPFPSNAVSVSCDSIDKVALGNAYGSSDEEIINGRGDATPMKLADGAYPVVVENGAIDLSSQPDLVHAWATNPMLGLWVIDREGATRPFVVDRCSALRPHYSVMTPAELSMFNTQCPIAPPAYPNPQR